MPHRAASLPFASKCLRARDQGPHDLPSHGDARGAPCVNTPSRRSSVAASHLRVARDAWLHVEALLEERNALFEAFEKDGSLGVPPHHAQRSSHSLDIRPC